MPRSKKYEVFPKIHSRQLGVSSPMSILNAARGMKGLLCSYIYCYLLTKQLGTVLCYITSKASLCIATGLLFRADRTDIFWVSGKASLIYLENSIPCQL